MKNLKTNINAQANVSYDNRTNRNYTENADMTPQKRFILPP